jgi:hypothetical protein
MNRALRRALIHEHDEPVGSEALPGRVGDRDVAKVRRVERAAVER